MSPPQLPRVDRAALSFGHLSEPADDKAYWLSMSHQARMEAIELSRQTVYGYDPASARLQRLLEIAQRPRR
jgi:hypothetical protein